MKTLQVLKTDTFLDQMFLDNQDKSLNGIPIASNSILVGIPNTGKTLFIMELALKFANGGRKTILCTSEDAWRTESARYDLESRMRDMAQKLSLNWQTISENLFVLDVVSQASMREWSNFISAYRSVVENEKAEILLCDSITLLEDNRGSIKYRLNEICRYGQTHGVTAIFVSQRAIDDPDSFSLAGGLSLSHIADIVFELDQKKISSWDANMKLDMGCKQSETVNFFRILKNRLCKTDMHFHAYSITPDGLVRLIPKSVNGNQKT
jgi:KaiC/GvpD/RAD55 family RecA-like ATPase